VVLHAFNAPRAITLIKIKHALKLTDYAKYSLISQTAKSVIQDMRSTFMVNAKKVKMYSV